MEPPPPAKRDWPHAPPHRLAESGVYFITARTLDQVPYFEAADRKDFVQASLFTLAGKYS